jgi:adenylate kinase
LIAKRIFITGPPGSNRKEVALALAEHFNWTCISVGDLLKKEVSKKSDLGKTIFESLKQHKYGNYQIDCKTVIVDDQVVLELVRAQVDSYEKDHASWIIEGFPRTKA